MKKLLSLALGLALLVPAARAAADPLAGWSEAQLKVKVLQLMKENQELKAKLGSPSTGSGQASAAKATKEMLLDDFEGDLARNGKAWWAGCDDNKLGTTLAPQPWAPSKGGSKASPGKAGRIHGTYGKNQEPWPWAALSLALADPDISGYSALRFNVKGDGKAYVARLGRAAVKDFAHYAANFTATKDWSTVTIKLADFAQPSWGAPVSGGFTDVEKVEFSPTVNEQAYDLWIDDVTLLP
jgi:hypothetical protein